jgi:hypothetical protein
MIFCLPNNLFLLIILSYPIMASRGNMHYKIAYLCKNLNSFFVTFQMTNDAVIYSFPMFRLIFDLKLHLSRLELIDFSKN